MKKKKAGGMNNNYKIALLLLDRIAEAKGKLGDFSSGDQEKRKINNGKCDQLSPLTTFSSTSSTYATYT